MKNYIFAILFLFFSSLTMSLSAEVGSSPTVHFTTNLGKISIELDAKNAPISTENFLAYAREGFYNGTIFHRVIPGFMVQGGGFVSGMEEKNNKAPIKNEAENGLKNDRGTIAMARTNVIDSATSQFFINLKDNSFLNNSPGNFGYAVFGKVIEGMETVDAMALEKTGRNGHHDDVPLKEIVILETEIKE